MTTAADLQQSENGNGPMPRSTPEDAVCIENIEIVIGPGSHDSKAVEQGLLQRWAAKLIVNCYRVTGLALLAFILVGLLSYLTLAVFYAINSTWISPQIISPSDDRVLHLNSEVAQAMMQREKLGAQRVDLLVRIRDADRKYQTATHFEREFVKSIQQAMTDEQQSLTRIKDLLNSHPATNPEIVGEENRYLLVAEAEAEKLYKAHLIDEEDYLSRKHQIGQATSSALSTEKGLLELNAASKVLDRQVQSHERLLESSTGSREALSYRVLREKQEYDRALLDKASFYDVQNAIRLELATVDREIGRQDALLASIRESPYLKAVSGGFTVAALPYANASRLRPGVPIFGCSVGIVWCRRVGQVTQIFGGEVIGKHPFYNKELRGELVQTKIEDPQWARRQVLFLNRAPLLF